MKELRDQAFELNSEFGSIGESVESLSDIKFLLGQIVVRMDAAVANGEEKIFIHEHQREIRILGKLLHHTVETLNEDYEKLGDIQDEIFKAVVKGER